MSRTAEILSANTAFYEAFSNRDITAMANIWSTRDAIACVHPAGFLLSGRGPVMASWEAILSGPGHGQLRHVDDVVFVMSDKAAFVVCTEVIGQYNLTATNLFVLEEGAWRMTHHHASPAAKSTAPVRRGHDEDRGPLLH